MFWHVFKVNMICFINASYLRGADWTTLTSTLIQGAPKLMSTSAPRVSDLLDTPLKTIFEHNHANEGY